MEGEWPYTYPFDLLSMAIIMREQQNNLLSQYVHSSYCDLRLKVKADQLGRSNSRVNYENISALLLSLFSHSSIDIALRESWQANKDSTRK